VRSPEKLNMWNIYYGIQEEIKNINEVGIIVDKSLKKEVEVRRIGDRIMLIKLVLGEEIINIISAYAP
jgi:hypothetical protein